MIVNSAVLHNGIIYTGKRHHNIFQSTYPLGCIKNGIQGFVTDTGKFVDRIEAAKIAIECGQIEKTKWGNELYSEDLW